MHVRSPISQSIYIAVPLKMTNANLCLDANEEK